MSKRLGFVITIFVVGALVLLIGTAASASPVRLNYVAANWPEAEGGDADNQARWNMAVDRVLADEPLANLLDVLNIPQIPFVSDAELWLSYNTTGTGFVDVESSPVALDHNPGVRLVWRFGDSELHYSPLTHRSNGESDEQSRSLNYTEIGYTIHSVGPSVQFDATFLAWSIYNSEYAETQEVWTVGDAAEFGFGGTAKLVFKDAVELAVDVRPEHVFSSISMLGGPSQHFNPMVYVYAGRGATLEALGDYERAIGVGASFDNLF